MKTRIMACSMVFLVGCGTLGTVKPANVGEGSVVRRVVAGIFTRAAMADLQFEGAAGKQEDLVSALALNESPQLAKTIQAALALGLIEPIGPRLMEVTLKGESQPRILICRNSMASQCVGILPNQGIRAYVEPVGLGGFTVYVIHRLIVL